MSSFVAPLVGAWIEIRMWYQTLLCNGSLPLWERGLKSRCRLEELATQFVAPLVGAWIEILLEIILSRFWKSRSPCGSVD